MASAQTSHSSASKLPEDHITEMMSRFEELVARARTIAFPPWRKGAALPPDMTGWSKFRRLAYTFSSPWPSSLTMSSRLPDIAFVLWLLVVLFWASAADAWFDNLFAAAVRQEVVGEQSITGSLAMCAITLFILPTVIVAYWSWIEFLRDSRYTLRWRVILVLVFVCVLFSSAFWLIEPENRALYPELLRADPSLMIGFAVTFVVLVLPILTFFYRIGVDLVIFAWAILTVIRPYGRSIFKPVLADHIRELALQPIPRCGDDAGTWLLTELSVEELHWLRTWASNNRESSDKRLLPTVVLFAAVGVFANTDTFRNAFDKFFSALYDWTESYLKYGDAVAKGEEPEPSWLVTGRYILVAVVVAVVMLFLAALFALFRNLVVQSLVIEACIVTEYAKLQQQEAVAGPTEFTPPPRRGVSWQGLINLLRRG